MRRWSILIAVGLAVAAVSLLSLRFIGDGDTTPPDEAQIQIGVGEPGGAGVDASSTGRFAPDSGEPQPGQGDVAPPPLPQLLGRKIVRNASLELAVEDVLGAVQRVESIAAGAGGFVASSNVFTDKPPLPLPLEEGDAQAREAEPPERTQTAIVTIRVPASEYAAVLTQLRGIAKEVQGESSSTSDVTEEFTDLQARLRNLEATEATYLNLLAKAETTQDILLLQDRINAVRLEIETIQGRINLLNELTDLATIDVNLRPFAPVDADGSSQNWAAAAAENAWETSQAVLRALGTGAIVGGTVLAWLAVPALAGTVAWRLLGLRRPGSGQA